MSLKYMLGIKTTIDTNAAAAKIADIINHNSTWVIFNASVVPGLKIAMIYITRQAIKPSPDILPNPIPIFRGQVKGAKVEVDIVWKARLNIFG